MHLPLVDAFSCMETEDELAVFSSKQRRRIKKHSQEIDNFLKTEALAEQEQGLNTTFLYTTIPAMKSQLCAKLVHEGVYDVGFGYFADNLAVLE